jgi:hypothetical protein
MRVSQKTRLDSHVVVDRGKCGLEILGCGEGLAEEREKTRQGLCSLNFLPLVGNCIAT